MYKGVKFQRRSLEEIKQIIDDESRIYSSARRIFLTDGDVMRRSFSDLREIAVYLRSRFTRLSRINLYATGRAIAAKSDEELTSMRELGYQTLYLGLESGDEITLSQMHKGETAASMISAAQRASAAGLRVSVMVLLGLAGRRGSQRHAQETAKLLSRIDPAYASALSIMIPEADEHREYKLRAVPEDTPWRELEPLELVAELRELVAGLECTDTVFRANHASNHLPLGGHLPDEKDELLALVDSVLKTSRKDLLRPEWMRGL